MLPLLANIKYLKERFVFDNLVFGSIYIHMHMCVYKGFYLKTGHEIFSKTKKVAEPDFPRKFC